MILQGWLWQIHGEYDVLEFLYTPHPENRCQIRLQIQLLYKSRVGVDILNVLSDPLCLIWTSSAFCWLTRLLMT